MNKKIAYRIGLIGVFSFAIFLVLMRILCVIKAGGHNWAVGEWLINYGGGFVRRGLTGQILLSLPFSRTVILIILFLAIFSIVVYVYLSVLIPILKSDTNFFSMFLVLNPAGMLFIAWDQNVFIRKEWLGLGILVLLSINTFKYKSLGIDLLIIMLFILALTSSEVNAVFIPAIMYLFSHSERKLTQKIICPLNKIFLSASVVTLIPLLFYHGDMKTSIAICEKVKISGFDPMLNCQGAIGTLGYSLTQALEHFKSDYPGYILYLPLALLSFFPIYLTSWYRSHRSLVKQVVLATAPLFLIAWDYGRWISIIVTQLTILILMESHFANIPKRLSAIELTHRIKLLLLFSSCFWGLGHGGNPLTNGWIGFFPSLGSFLIG